jgi:hypothetical protein
VLQYPLPLLTVTCLVEGIIAALIHKHDYKLKWRKSILQSKQKTKDSSLGKKRQRTVRRIEEGVEGVIHDIQAIVGISDVSDVVSK